MCVCLSVCDDCAAYCNVFVAYRAAFRAAEVPRLRCVVGVHPSLQNGWKLYGEESEEKLCEAVTCPVLFLPAGNDPAAVKRGGHQLAILKAKPFGADCDSIDCAC